MKKWKIILLGLFIAGIAVAVATYFLVYNKPHPDYEKAKPEVVISAEDLYFSFISDKTGANIQFNRKVIAIDGSVAMVEQIDELLIVSFVFEDGFFGGEGVRCTMLEGHHEKALNLVPGEHVEIKGLCTGFTGSDVILEYGSFQ